MKLKLRTANGTIIYPDDSASTVIFADDGRAWIRNHGSSGTELDDTLFTQQRYEAFLIWMNANWRPEFVDFTHPDKLIVDGHHEIITAEMVTNGPADQFQAQLTAAGFSVKAPS